MISSTPNHPSTAHLAASLLSPGSSPQRQRLLLALDAADQASAFILEHYQNPSLRIDVKPDGSVVTPADKGAEDIIRKCIARDFPKDGVLGEEYGESTGATGVRWVIDPIDGTRSFTCGMPTFGTLIGIEQDGIMVAGVACFPALRECVWALRGDSGAGAWWRTSAGQVRPARISGEQSLERAYVQSASAQGFSRHIGPGAFDALTAATARHHGWNDAFSFALVATGRADAVVGFKFSLWDVAPFLAIVPEAGGRLTAWDGQGPPLRTVIGANPSLHAELARTLGPHAPRA